MWSIPDELKSETVDNSISTIKLANDADEDGFSQDDIHDEVNSMYHLPTNKKSDAVVAFAQEMWQPKIT